MVIGCVPGQIIEFINFTKRESWPKNFFPMLVIFRKRVLMLVNTIAGSHFVATHNNPQCGTKSCLISRFVVSFACKFAVYGEIRHDFIPHCGLLCAMTKWLLYNCLLSIRLFARLILQLSEHWSKIYSPYYFRKIKKKFDYENAASSGPSETCKEKAMHVPRPFKS